MERDPFILSVETSSRIGSVAIAFGEKLIAEKTFSGSMKHSMELFPAIEGLLESVNRKPHQIEQVYISAGPGSFTGLRIATTLAKLMHLANATKIITVDTLDVIAANVISYINEKIASNINSKTGDESIDRFATVLDAKRGRFFIAVYNRLCEKTDIQYGKILSDCLMSASDFIDRFVRGRESIWLLGDGLLYHKDKFKTEGVFFIDQKYCSPRVDKVHLLGWKKAQQYRFAEPVALTPVYLSRPNVTIRTQ